MKIIETIHVTKEYRMGDQVVKALDDVSIEVQQGEFVAIMGPSGSGKSTLLHLLGGLDTPTSGEVILGGQRLSSLSDDELTRVRRQKIGFIFQFYNLLPTLSAEENIVLPLLLDGKPANQQQAWLNVLLTMVGLVSRRGHRPSQLSGGQQQRVAIARAFINQPEIVLGDEPTGNLDSRTGTSILELLKRTCGDLAATIVMVTHDPRAASYADRVIFLKDGKLVYKLCNNGSAGDGQAVLNVMAALE